MIKILLAAALAIAIYWNFYQHDVIEARKRDMRMQEVMFAKERHDLLRQLEDAKTLAAIVEEENRLAIMELSAPASGKLPGNKGRHGNRILMDVEPRSDLTSLPQENN